MNKQNEALPAAETAGDRPKGPPQRGGELDPECVTRLSRVRGACGSSVTLVQTLIMITLLLCFLLSACSGAAQEGSGRSAAASASSAEATSVGQPSAGDTAIAFTDLADRSVALAKLPERIIVANYIANYLIVGGAKSLDKVVGMTLDGWEDTRFGEHAVFTEAFPNMLGGKGGIASIGGYHDDILNAELIVSLQPDVILMNRTQFTENNQSIPVFESAGIQVVVLDYHAMQVENHTRSTKILGRLLNREEIADEQNNTYTGAIQLVSSRIEGLQPDQKGKRVYVELGNKGVAEYGNSYNNTMLWGAILGNIGAHNIAEGIEASYGPLDKEFVLSQNPEIIVIGGSIWSGDTGGDQMRMGFTVDEDTARARLNAFAARSEWAGLDAVKNGEIYGVDHGSLRNMSDYAYTLFLAKIVYPELFEDIDPAREIDDYYAKYLPELSYTGTFLIQMGREP